MLLPAALSECIERLLVPRQINHNTKIWRTREYADRRAQGEASQARMFHMKDKGGCGSCRRLAGLAQAAIIRHALERTHEITMLRQEGEATCRELEISGQPSR